MDIVFGLYADGGASPDHGGDGHGTLGAPVVGPHGLLDIVETNVGLSEPPAAFLVRIAAWQAALAAAGTDRFWSASLAVDGWSSARTLLAWRDMLVEAGWSASDDWPAGRIADLAAAERLADDMPAGVADRLRRILPRIRPTIAGTIRRVRLIDPKPLHSIGWRNLLDALEAAGVVIESMPVTPAAAAGTALGQMQRWMMGDSAAPTVPDGSITLASAASGLLAADIIGQWARVAADRDGVMALIAQDGDSQLLDHGLATARQPRAGRSRRSPHRGTLQLLLLGFKISWAPFDPHALMELLLFANSPIAGRVAGRLADALEAAPGRGSSEWADAWATIEAEEHAAAEDAKAAAAVTQRLTRWRAWAEPSVWDPVEGMPVAEAVAICDRTISWALTRHANGGDSLYLSTASLAGDVRSALLSLDRPLLPRTLIERVIDQALDTGEADPAAIAEAAPWRAVSHPGAIWGPVDDVLWWNFSATREGAGRMPWTVAERALLAGRGCGLDEPEREGLALSAAWERAILNCRRRLLFVSAGLEAHDEANRHPVAHRLAVAIKDGADHLRLEAALASEQQELAGETLERVAITSGNLPSSRAQWTTPPGFAERLDGQVESATSFENLFSCQLMWALRHVARLRLGRARAIPDENRLLGNLAHALAREIFIPGQPPAPMVAQVRTVELLDSAIDRLAAPLRHPSFASGLAFARRRLPSAMAALAESLEANQLTVEATEHQISATFEQALAVRGAIDLVARDHRGEAVIVDLKWTRNPKSRIEELKSGQAVQLATYGAALTGAGPYRAGYYMLNQRQLLTLANAGLIGRATDGTRSLPATWDAITASWAGWRDAAADGTLVAAGVEGANALIPADVTLIREVRCDRCDYQTLCRVRGLR
ncbi:PD-(D/E)XK nuclease family protein [Sphingomonas sp. PR090111-T3T-6A]|uniref:PD-(D/E)XK nuclease family protein n=1 Tax=Sphingomonas sp. PR090111-T3T-6A TaxID=685778 RepID=UPI0003A0471E|nr:PD-(D/E)XK nuclease family protein [Sphingomonas sp. PR090111-T3T-6A]